MSLLTKAQYRAALVGGYTAVFFLTATDSVIVSDVGRSTAGSWSRWASLTAEGKVTHLLQRPYVGDLREYPLDGLGRAVLSARKEEAYWAAVRAAKQ
jgi:hypothetical protein